MAESKLYRIKILYPIILKKSSSKSTSIPNSLFDDSRLSVLPVSHRWMFIGLLLACGDMSTDTLLMSENRLRVMLLSSKSIEGALASYQSLQLLSYEIVDFSEKTPSLYSIYNYSSNSNKREGKKALSTKRPEKPPIPPPIEPEPPKAPGMHWLGALWNEYCGTKLPKIKSTDARLKVVLKRVTENPDHTYWIEVIKSVATSDFCTGNNDRHWAASFDWLLGNDKNRVPNHVKVSEGSFRNRRQQSVPETLRVEPGLDAEIDQMWADARAQHAATTSQGDGSGSTAG